MTSFGTPAPGSSLWHLEGALRARGLVVQRPDLADYFRDVAMRELRKAIGAANREGNRKRSGLALLALAKARAELAAA